MSIIGNPMDVVAERRQAYLDDPSDRNRRRLEVAVQQANRGVLAVGTVDNRVDLAAVVKQRRAAFDDDPSPRNRRRLDVAEAQFAEKGDV